MFCKKQEHLGKYYKYCSDCALNGKILKFVFYCQCCHSIAKQQHDSHSDQSKSICDKAFIAPLSAIRIFLQQQIRKKRGIFTASRKRYRINDFDQVLQNLKQKYFFLHLIDQNKQLTQFIMNKQLMQWLLDIKFWQAHKQKTLLAFNQKLHNLVKQKIKQYDSQLASILYPTGVIQNQFEIKWNPQTLRQTLALENDVDQILSNQTNTLQTLLEKMNKQRDIFDFTLRLFSSYNLQQCFNTLDLCDKLLKLYPKAKILYLSKIRLCQLIPQRNIQIPKILKQIVKQVDPKFQSNDLYYYYMAQAEWQMIQFQQDIMTKKKQQQLLFFQLKNKQYYYLVNVDKYIDNLTKANAIRQKAVYWACLGIGYVVKKKYQQAARMFKNASALMGTRNNAVDLNKFWAEIHNPESNPQFQAIMQNLQTRPLQFITNIAKYFKKQRKCQQLVVCCQELLSRQPTNQNFKIQWIKSILYYSSQLDDFKLSDNQKLNRAQTLLTQLKRAKQNQANKLQKRLLRMRARHDFHKQNLSQAIQMFDQVTKRNIFTSATDYYNLASTLFKKYVKQQCDDQDLIKQALENINQAIKLASKKTKPIKLKYIKLKFFACCYLRLFNQALMLYERCLKGKQQGIDQKVYGELIEHINNNQEQDWGTPTGDGMKMN